MKFEPLDAVVAYKSLKAAFPKVGRTVHVSILFYMWRRLALFNLQAGTIVTAEDARNLEVCLDVVGCSSEHISQLAELSEARALGVREDEYKLAIVGYWSVLSYLYRYLDSSDWIYVDHASDAFLDALESSLSDDQLNAFKNELLNLEYGFETAEALSSWAQIDAAHEIVGLVQRSPIGSTLSSSG